MKDQLRKQSGERTRTGISGLDDVLCGGLPANRVYLLQGDPGVGKTTLSLQFLLEGVRQKDPVLYVTLSETRAEVEAVAASHGWDLTGLTIHEMAPTGEDTVDQENTLYVPDEVELGERMRTLFEVVDKIGPHRIVIDSCSELRLLARTPLRFRKQILAMKDDLIRRRCTILLLENPLQNGGDVLLQSLVHGVIEMQQRSPMYGAERRRLRVLKMREVSFRGGYHDLLIQRGGVRVFPRLVAAEHHRSFPPETLSSGVGNLDQLLGGGLDRGTCTLMMGPAGSGKSAITCQYAYAAASRGEHVALYTFDEGSRTLFERSAALGNDLRPLVENGALSIQQIDPAELSPGQFIDSVREAVEVRNARMVVIDSLNGYLHAMPEENFVLLQLHEMLSYLRQRGVVTILVVSQSGLLGSNMGTAVDVSYIADTVMLLRYFEGGGRVRKAVSVLKKRSGRHEDSIRELTMGKTGVQVGPILAGLRGVLSGVPVPEKNWIADAVPDTRLEGANNGQRLG